MKFKEINKDTNNPQTIRVYNTEHLDINATYTLDHKKIDAISLEVVQQDNFNKYKMVSAHLCSNFLKNKGIHHLLINMIKDKSEPNQSIIHPTINGNPKIDSHTFIMTTVYLYDHEDEEINSCKYDPLGFHQNPESKDGTIIIGRP
ncbi:hypothetical protein [Polaribacter sp.]|uniref:hypothetical protein n=1 Tax=Polaribacter sp. TaxID=1920175 RepID=UPI003EFABE83